MGLDRNTLIGISLICAIMFAWMWYSAPTKEELAKQKRTKDSLELVQKQNTDTVRSRQSAIGKDTSIINHQPSTIAVFDSAKNAALNNKYDVFASAATGKDEFFTIENELIKATISKKGGRICSVNLKNYKTHDQQPLNLFDTDSSSFGLDFFTESNRTIKTSELYFQQI